MALLAGAKRSPAYRALRPRVMHPYPSDSWYDDGCAFIVFDLHPTPDGRQPDAGRTARALFVLAAASGELLAARVVEVGGAGEVARVDDLVREEQT